MYGDEQTEGNKALRVDYSMAAILSGSSECIKSVFYLSTILVFGCQVVCVFYPLLLWAFFTASSQFTRVLFSVCCRWQPCLLGVGIIFWITRKVWLRVKKASVEQLENLTVFSKALWIGIGSGICIIPGTQSSGVQRLSALCLLLKSVRPVQAFLFLNWRCPSCMAASGLRLYYQIIKRVFCGSSFIALLVGFVVAFVSAFVANENCLCIFGQNLRLWLFGCDRIVFVGFAVSCLALIRILRLCRSSRPYSIDIRVKKSFTHRKGCFVCPFMWLPFYDDT